MHQTINAHTTPNHRIDTSTNTRQRIRVDGHNDSTQVPRLPQSPCRSKRPAPPHGRDAAKQLKHSAGCQLHTIVNRIGLGSYRLNSETQFRMPAPISLANKRRQGSARQWISASGVGTGGWLDRHARPQLFCAASKPVGLVPSPSVQTRHGQEAGLWRQPPVVPRAAPDAFRGVDRPQPATCRPIGRSVLSV